MRFVLLASAFVLGAAPACAAETPSPVQAWQVAMSRKLAASAGREHRACGKRCPFGRAVVGFVVHRDGAVTAVRIVDGSGKPALDEKALHAVRAASPLPPIPPEIAEDARTIQVPLRFAK